jgi:hypothetical protein
MCVSSVTARCRDCGAQGVRWVVQAGGALAPGVSGVEVPALLSYAGEGLGPLVAGRVVGGPSGGAVLLHAAAHKPQP